MANSLPTRAEVVTTERMSIISCTITVLLLGEYSYAAKTFQDTHNEPDVNDDGRGIRRQQPLRQSQAVCSAARHPTEGSPPSCLSLMPWGQSPCRGHQALSSAGQCGLSGWGVPQVE